MTKLTAKLTRVLAAVVQRDELFLICRRPPNKRHAGLWEFPGGKYEAGESAFEAAHRELREELCVEVLSTGRVQMSVRDPGSVFVIEFTDVEIRGEPIAVEHTAIAWVDLTELRGLELAPADAEFACSLLMPVMEQSE